MPDDLNPKDLQGLKKVPLGLVPAAGKILTARAMEDGARKYGPYNWRTKAVRMSIYLDAIERHLLALRDGEDSAADSGVHHLGHIAACCFILTDAASLGKLVDDRPTPGAGARLLAEAVKQDDRAAQEIRAPGITTPFGAVPENVTRAYERRDIDVVSGP